MSPSVFSDNDNVPAAVQVGHISKLLEVEYPIMEVCHDKKPKKLLEKGTFEPCQM